MSHGSIMFYTQFGKTTNELFGVNEFFEVIFTFGLLLSNLGPNEIFIKLIIIKIC